MSRRRVDDPFPIMPSRIDYPLTRPTEGSRKSLPLRTRSASNPDTPTQSYETSIYSGLYVFCAGSVQSLSQPWQTVKGPTNHGTDSVSFSLMDSYRWIAASDGPLAISRLLSGLPSLEDAGRDFFHLVLVDQISRVPLIMTASPPESSRAHI